METLLIVIGCLLILFFGPTTLACLTATKNEENFNQFKEELDKRNTSASLLPDEQIYALLCKIQNFSAVTFVVGLLLLGLGITLIVL